MASQMQLLKDIRRRLHSSPQVWEPIWPQDSILICTSVTKTEQCVNVQCVCVCVKPLVFARSTGIGALWVRVYFQCLTFETDQCFHPPAGIKNRCPYLYCDFQKTLNICYFCQQNYLVVIWEMWKSESDRQTERERFWEWPCNPIVKLFSLVC